MSNIIINGMQWGDEGKGKIVDLLCPAFDAVIRYQGGDNAGHTVKFEDRHFALHLVPSGILHPGMQCVLGSGMVVNPETLFEEIEGLEKAGVRVRGNLRISARAHVLLPIHRALDQSREAAMGSGQIGTTARGIGPAYESKVSRYGIRMCDLGSRRLRERLERLLERHHGELAAAATPVVPTVDELYDLCRDWASRLEPFVQDTEIRINEWIGEGKAMLFEGAQGTLLDIDHGTYPYVTSSTPTAGGACSGAGIAPSRIDGVIGVLKAYTTRVGGGPFVTELTDQSGEFLRTRGNEFGTTTGRPRRCGWLDTVVARHSRMLSGVDSMALTKLDVLDDFEEIRICVGYRIGDETVHSLPPLVESLEEAEPMYKTLPGWRQNTVGVVDYSELPSRARDYVELIAAEVGCPIGIVSTGPRREETIVRSGAGLEALLDDRLDSVMAQVR